LAFEGGISPEEYLKKRNISLDRLFADRPSNEVKTDLHTIVEYGSTTQCGFMINLEEGNEWMKKEVVINIPREAIPAYCYITGFKLHKVLTAGGVPMVGRIVKSTQQGERRSIASHESRLFMLQADHGGKDSTRQTAFSAVGTWSIPRVFATEADLGGSVHTQAMTKDIADLQKYHPSVATLNIMVINNRFAKYPNKGFWSFDAKPFDTSTQDGALCEHHRKILVNLIRPENMAQLVKAGQLTKMGMLCKILEDHHVRATDYVMSEHVEVLEDQFYFSEPLFMALHSYIARMDTYGNATLGKDEMLQLVLTPFDQAQIISQTWSFSGELVLYLTTVRL